MERVVAGRNGTRLTLALALAFGVAYTQAPLYYSNQNQYFVHGLAQGGLGFLSEDWLANTRDPTPVFTAIVAFTYRHLHVDCFYVDYFLLLGLYFYSLAGVCAGLPARQPGRLAWFAFLTLLIALHAAILRIASVRLFGVDYPWYFQAGVANQYILGPGLQPSVFGVLLLTSLLAFVRNRPIVAGLFSSAAAVVHPTYLLPAALLDLAYMFVLYREGRGRTGLLLGAVALLAVLPVVAYNLWAFAPESAEQFAEAQRLLANVRIPHHTQVGRWLDGVAVGQLAWLGLALVLVRRTRLFPVLALPAIASVLLTLVQLATGSDILALLFPWRISAVLLPVATAVILFRLTSGVAAWLSAGVGRPSLAVRTAREGRPTAVAGPGQWLGWAASGLVLTMAAVGGLVVTLAGIGYAMNDDELPALDFVRRHQQPGQVYLLPVRIPPVGSGPRGAISASFTPPPRRGKAGNQIPVDLQRFRLVTGTPIYVDFKSIPYKDTEVLEWFRRMRQCERWYERRNWSRGAVAAELAPAGITHILTTADRDLDGDGLERIYEDQFYRIYRVRGGSG
jgi:hypothetical protein